MACMTVGQVNEGFLASPPLIAQEIRNLTIKHPNFLADVAKFKDWPVGQGNSMQEIVFRGAMPEIERGFTRWKKLGDMSGCEPCDGPDCAYNWTQFGGHGLNRRMTELMSREFRSPDYCVNEIAATNSFEQLFPAIVQNLYAQTDFFKENSITLNWLASLSKKYVVDSDGPKINKANPYVYRNIGSPVKRLSTLNMYLLEFFYNALRRTPDSEPYAVVNGKPMFALVASDELLANLYRDDPNLRQDLRFSGYANDLIDKYNFTTSLRGMFMPVEYLFPRRFVAVAGELMEVLPWLNGIPAEVGQYTGVNPDYEVAPYEEILIHGMYPFTIYTQATPTSLGGGTSFGPGFTFMENWMWVNPPTECDPFRRVGYFATEAKIGIAAQHSEGIYGLVVERRSQSVMAVFTPNPVCPVAPPVCSNSIPADTCPCPVVLDITANPMTANNYFFTFAQPVTGTAAEVVNLELDSGLYVTGTLVAISADGLTASITFAGGLAGGTCANIVGVYCASTVGCSANVVSQSDCRSGVTADFTLTLSNAIKAITVGQNITGYAADCTEVVLNIVSVDVPNLTWRVNVEGGTPTAEDFICRTGGISRVCVPTASDASCPACGVTTTPCGTIDIGN